MLASVIPGLRDARTPLVCGYAWLVSAWLAIHPLVSALDPRLQPLLGDLSKFLGFFGGGALVIAVSVIAYLIGTTVQLDSQFKFVGRVGISASIEENLLMFTKLYAQEAVGRASAVNKSVPTAAEERD